MVEGNMAKATKTRDPLDLLAKVGLFDGLARKELQTVYRSAKAVHFPAGRTIVMEGATGVGFHMITSGKAKVTVKGRTRATLGPGDYFGEMSLIDRGPRSATVVATTEVDTLSLASWSFLTILDKNPTISRKLLIELSRRLRSLEKSVHSH
jgi:CRP/FNR family cyclic AMP-dependent transcriptional regulator